jgi:chromosomal replication initiator protein
MIEPITAEEMRSAFAQYGSRSTGRKRAKAIIDEVALYWDVSSEDLLGPCRARDFTTPRFEAMHRMREELGFSYPHIGRVFNRDHTSVLHGIRRWKALSPKLKQERRAG